MPQNKKKVSRTVRAFDIVYMLLLALAFYFLYLSRRDEVLTVWGVIHPAFNPTFIVATFLLLTIMFSAERTEYKLLFAILHSIISHSLFIIIFPAGNLGAQQTILGQTRLVFDNIILHGFGSTRESLPLILYVSFRGENFQAGLSVVFARMLCVDVYWTHLLLVPLLWGTFVPLIAFMISKKLSGNENISVLAGLVTSLFPTTILWGAVSIPNGLSYLFFFCFVFFLLKYIKNNARTDFFLVIMFFSASLLTHYLVGAIAFSLFLLAYGVKMYKTGKQNSPMNAKLMLLISFVLSASVMPFALVYRRLFYPTANTHFSLQKVYELPITDLISSLLLGRYFDLLSREAYITTFIFGIPAVVALIALLYILSKIHKKPTNESVTPLMVFLFLGFLLIVVNDRVINLFMTNVPFIEMDRLWVFRDFLLSSFAALFISGALWETRALFDRLSKTIFAFWRKIPPTHEFSKAFSFIGRGHLVKGVSTGTVLAYILIFLIVSGWVNASVYYAYPHWAPLQTTSYEMEAVKEIHETTKEKYIVIADQWTIFAGQMFAGIKNPRAFYFSPYDPHGISLFLQMRINPMNETLIESMKYNNATVAYFVIAKPRLGVETYNNVVEQAQDHGLQTYKTFYYRSEEKLHIFYYKKI